MDKESYYGFVEYKRHIKLTSPFKHNSLVSQLRYRLIEGNGRCIYIIGVEDNGTIFNLNEDDYNETLKNLENMCIDVKATIVSNNKIIKELDYYWEIIINDIITNNEYRILNIINQESDLNEITIHGIDKNNNILTLDDTTSYDIKKESEHLIYINSISIINSNNIIRNVLNYKPHIVNFNLNDGNIHNNDKYINLFKELDIPYTTYSNIKNNIYEIIKLKKESIQKINDKNIFSIFQTLYKGTILNGTKIYACITNNIIKDKNLLYIYDSNKNKNKLLINEIQHIYQPVSKINNDKLISISTPNKINQDHHICQNDCNCSLLYTDSLSLSEHNINTSDLIEKKEYNGYYKNSILKVSFLDEKIKFNKKILLDNNILIVDIESKFLTIFNR
jgi:hypothetical protein